MATFKRQNIVAYATLLAMPFREYENLPEAERNALDDKLQQAQTAAYAIVEAQYQQLPGYRQPSEHPDDNFDVEMYELGADDEESQVFRGLYAHGIRIHSVHRLDAAAVSAFAQLVYRAFAEVAPKFGFESKAISVSYRVTKEIVEESHLYVDEHPYLAS